MSIFAPVNQSGKKNIADLQRLVNLMGHSSIQVDGVMGPNTTKALWSLPSEAQVVAGQLASARQVPYPRAPIVSMNGWSKGEIVAYIRKTATRLGVNADLAVKIAKIESDLDPNARSNTGAVGLFQLTTPAIKDVLRTNSSLKVPSGTGKYDIKWNVEVGVRYLKIVIASYLKQNPFTDDVRIWTDAYSVYNIGYGNFKKLRARKFSDPDLLAALDVQAGYLASGGATKYLTAVQSKLESVVA